MPAIPMTLGDPAIWTASQFSLDVLLQPGESVTTSRVFRLPADASGLGLITGQGGPGCFPACFIIGDNASLFNKRTFVRPQ